MKKEAALQSHQQQPKKRVNDPNLWLFPYYPPNRESFPEIGKVSLVEQTPKAGGTFANGNAHILIFIQ